MMRAGLGDAREDFPACPGLLPGVVVQVTPEGSAAFRSVFLGMDFGQFLIIKIPAGVDLAPKIFQKNHLTLRYIGLGQVFGFRTTLIGLAKEPTKLAFLAYPSSTQSVNLRKSKRLECSLSAVLNYSMTQNPEDDIEGRLTDISVGGGSFLAQAHRIHGNEGPAVGDAAVLTIQLPGHEGEPLPLEVEIRRVQRDRETVCIGLQFAARGQEREQEEHTAQMAIYAFCEKMEEGLTAFMAP